MTLAEELKAVCLQWININKKIGFVPLALVQMRLIVFHATKFHTATEIGNFKRAFSELVDLNHKLNTLKNRFSSVSKETRQLLEISIGELMQPEKDITSAFQFSDLQKFMVDLEKSISEAQNAAQDMKSTKANYYPLRVCHLAKSLAPLAGFEEPLPKNINKDNGFGLFLEAIFFTVKKYEKVDDINIINAWRSYNKNWYSFCM